MIRVNCFLETFLKKRICVYRGIPDATRLAPERPEPSKNLYPDFANSDACASTQYLQLFMLKNIHFYAPYLAIVIYFPEKHLYMMPLLHNEDLNNEKKPCIK